MTLAPATPHDLPSLAPTATPSARAALEARLDDPGVVESLTALLDHADLLAVLVDGLDGFVGRSETIGDSVISGLTELRGVVDSGALLPDLGAPLPDLLAAVRQLAGILPQIAPQVVAAVEAGGADELALFTTGLARGHADFIRNPVEVGGIRSIGRLLRDPDVARTLSYLATIGKAVGRELGAARARP